MVSRRIFYTLLLTGTFCLCIAYQRWLAWFLLYALLALPVFSLLISLPAMIWAKFRLALPNGVQRGQPVELQLEQKCPVPVPLWRCKYQVALPMTGQHLRYKDGNLLPTEHCGALDITVRRAGIFDYLGLIRLPLRLKRRNHRLFVRPVPVPIPNLPTINQTLRHIWKPKAGGGFAENHELRLYRPGDNIQQIHWKLSAKTGSLILREPMEPVRGKVLLRMDLKGDAAQLDTKLGQLLWLGQKLLAQDIHFEIHCLTGEGVHHWPVSSQDTLDKALNGVLCQPKTTTGSLLDQPVHAHWQYFIGGEHHEG
ncbi:MAG: DUF58 domain-containing protein [Ruminococcaceae bacterium]|nr:DUF58 domain-containing protein [Oscillospiraceae bacterium]